MFFYSADVCWVIVFDVIQCINSLAETRHPQCYRWSLQILACCFMWLSAFHRRLDHILLYKHCFYNDTWFEHSLAIKFGSNHSKNLFVSFALCLYFSFLFFRCQVWSGHWPSWLCDSLWLTMFSWSWWCLLDYLLPSSFSFPQISCLVCLISSTELWLFSKRK